MTVTHITSLLPTCRHRHRWLGFIDTDEFVVLHDGTGNGSTAAAVGSAGPTGAGNAADCKPDIRHLLMEYEGFGALALNWVMFGSNGHLQRPRGGVLINYHECLPLQNG